jgi:hypothetical protein
MSPVSVAGTSSPELDSATILEGEDLCTSGQYREEIAQCERALENLRFDSRTAAQNLKTICMLKKAGCLLKLEDWEACVQVCTQVLQGMYLLDLCWKTQRCIRWCLSGFKLLAGMPRCTLFACQAEFCVRQI